MEPEIKKRWELRFVWVMLAIILLGGGFLGWHYEIDGTYINKPVTYRDGVDPNNLQLEKTEYHRGEMVSFETSFCKNRDARVTVQWTLANDRLIFFAPHDSGNASVGCYPSDPNGRISVDIEKVPADAQYGEHYFVASVTRELDTGRVITTYLKTEKFKVVPL